MTDPDCPGRFKCHGPVMFCNECGDVDLVCDDPKCQVHARGSERKADFDAKTLAFFKAEQEYKSALKELTESDREWRRWQTGNVIMVSR